MIRVLHVFNVLNMGGAETMIMNVYRNIDRKKIQFDFLCMSSEKGDYDDEVYRLGGKIYRIEPPKKVGYIKHIREIIRVCKQYGPYKAIHIPTKFHSGFVCLAAYIAKVPIRIVHAHTAGEKDKSIKRKIYNFVGRRLINIFSTHKIACGEKAGIFLFGKKDIKNMKVMILNNGIEVEKYKNIEIKKVENLKIKYNIKNNEIVIGHIGRFVEVKNHEFFLDLAEALNNLKIKFKILLIGDGELKKNMQQKVKERKLENYFVFTGKINDIPSILEIIDVFVLPSLYEGFPMVLLDTFAAGKNCVVSDTDSKEIAMEPGFAKVVNLNDIINKWIDAILEQTKEKVDKKQRIKSLCEKGFSIEKTTKELSQIYLSNNK